MILKKTKLAHTWLPIDFMIAEAYQMLQSERCPQCGLPVYICHSTDRRLRIEIREDTCEVEVEKERREEVIKTSNDGKLPEGTVLRVEPYMVDGSDLVELREPYWEQENARRSELELVR
jgi:hypothetical protein